MADGGEVLVENSKSEGEEELDLARCASEFAQYCQVDVRNESKAIEDTIEDMLTRLDEFSHLADTIRNDSSQSLMEVMPQLHVRSQELPAIFRKIDQLEAFVNAVKKSVDELDESVTTAERELGSHVTIKKVLSSIPGLRQMGQGPIKDSTEWQAPVIFKTSDFFGATSVDELSTASSAPESEKKPIDLPSEEQAEDSSTVNR